MSIEKDGTLPDPEGIETTQPLDGQGRSAGGMRITIPQVGPSLRGILEDAGLAPDAEGVDDEDPLRYRIGSVVDRGGLGAVVAARDLNCNRLVAIKVLQPQYRHHPEKMVRFISEGQLTSQLEHPNIVPIYEMGADADGQAYYAMKFIRGRSLREILDSLAAGNADDLAEFTLVRLLNIFLRICDAVAFAHSRHVIHRDLKPANIMIGDFGEVLVLDWGLAKALHPDGIPKTDPQADVATALETVMSIRDDDAGNVVRTNDGEAMGTPMFMSPEQAAGQAATTDYRTDVYALGAILYNILTLRRPVSGKDVREILRNVLLGRIPHPSTIGVPSSAGDPTGLAHCPQGRVPDGLAAVAMKALARDPDNRYPSVSALRDDVEAWLHGFATAAERATPWRQLALWMKRHQKEVRIVVAAAAVVVILVAAFMLRLRAETHRALAGEAAARASEAQTRAALVREQRERYVSNVGLAQSHIGNGAIPAAETLLWDTPSELRGWEWGYLMRQCRPSLYTHVTTSVQGLAFGKAGKTLWIGAGSRVERLDLRTGEKVGTGIRCDEMLADLRLLAHDTEVLTGSWDGAVKLWNVASGEVIREFVGPETAVKAFDVSPDEALVAGGTAGGRLYLWDLASGRLRHRFEVLADPVFLPKLRPGSQYAGVAAVDFSPDGTRILGLHPHGVLIYDVATGRPALRVWEGRLITAVRFSPDGQLVAMGTGGGEVRVVRSDDGKTVADLKPHRDGSIFQLRFTDNDHLLSAAADNTVRLTEVSTGRQLACFSAHQSFVRKLALSPDHRLLASGDALGAVNLWAIDGDLGPMPPNQTLRFAAFSPDGRRLVVGSTRSIDVRETAGGQTVCHRDAGKISNYVGALSPDGRRLTVSDFAGGVCVYDTRTLVPVVTPAAHAKMVNSVDFSPDGTRLVTAGHDGTVRIWDLDRDQQLGSWSAHHLGVWSAVFGPGGDQIAVAPQRGGIVILDGRTGAVVKELGGGPFVSLAFSPDGSQLAAGGLDGHIHLIAWDSLDTNRCFTGQHGDWVMALRFSPDGRRLASGSRDRTVRIWDTATGRQLIVLDRGQSVYDVEFSPDGLTLAIATQPPGILHAFDPQTTDKAAVDAWQAQRWQEWRNAHGLAAPEE